MEAGRSAPSAAALAVAGDMPREARPTARGGARGSDPVEGAGALLAGEIQLCIADLDAFDEDLVALGATLPADEQQRALQIRAENRRRQFLVGRVVLRELLRRRLGAGSHAASFRYLPGGKPVLETPGATVHFNLAHSGSVVVVALCGDEPVGVDVERIRPVQHLAAIARSYFTPSERQWLESLEDSARPEGFMRLWTAKEAAVKASGGGISAGWTSYEVQLHSGIPIAVRATDRIQVAWHLQQPRIGAGYILSIAAAREGIPVRTLAWNPHDLSR
jgi:4'-phosphopantetheinyl transferase